MTDELTTILAQTPAERIEAARGMAQRLAIETRRGSTMPLADVSRRASLIAQILESLGEG